MAENYHVSGIAGVGMSALAELLVGLGHRVSGSDRFIDQGRELEVLRKLRAQGVRLCAQDGSGLDDACTALVVSTAIEPDNPERIAAEARGIPVLHRAELLARVLEGQPCAAVAGTSGKTTVTGLTGWLLEQAGLDPRVVNGGAVVDWIGETRLGSVRLGNQGPWVIEADESDKSFLRFSPQVATINNISQDHFEQAEAEELFVSFTRRVKGPVICGPGVADVLRGRVDVPLVEEQFELVRPDAGGAGAFAYKDRVFNVTLPGRHNLENAFMATLLCEHLGADLDTVCRSLPAFKGIQRRLERIPTQCGIAVYDDYAHNPAKIQAAWSAVAGPETRVFGIWRPHGFAPLAMMMEELSERLASVCGADDQVFILPVFYAGGTATRKADSRDLVDLLQQRGVAAHLGERYEALEELLLSQLRPGDSVLCMGARDPDLPLFARRLGKDLDVRLSQ